MLCVRGGYKNDTMIIKKKGNIVWANEEKTAAKFEENELVGKWQVRYWKPNLFQRFMYWVGLMKDPRYNGKKMDKYRADEYMIGVDPYRTDK